MPDESLDLVQLPGSERSRLESATPAGQLDTSERAELTLVLRRRPKDTEPTRRTWTSSGRR